MLTNARGLANTHFRASSTSKMDLLANCVIWSVPTSVVLVGHVRMGVARRLVAMQVAVQRNRHRIVRMIGVSVSVRMRVFVLQLVVRIESLNERRADAEQEEAGDW